MGWILVPDRSAGYAPQEVDWDTYIKNNLNTGVIAKAGSVVLASPAATIEFASVSGSWRNLLLVAYLRSAAVGVSIADVRMVFNTDTGANYDFQLQRGGAASTLAFETYGATSILVGSMPGPLAGANLFCPLRIFIPAYAQTSGHKVSMSSAGSKIGTSTTNIETAHLAGFWRNTAAITNVRLVTATGNFDTGCRATLYYMP